MQKIVAIARLEFFFLLKRIEFAIYFVFLFFGCSLFINFIGGAFSLKFIDSDLKINSSQFVSYVTSVIMMMSTFIVSSFATKTSLRDIDSNSFVYTFSYPIKKYQYFFGKFFASLVINIFLFSSILIAFSINSELTWLNRSLFLPFSINTYSSVFFEKILINVFFLNAVFFSVGLIFRNSVVNWIVVFLFYLLYFLAVGFYDKLSTREIASLLDPFGLIAAKLYTIGMSQQEIDITSQALKGYYLWNRVIWTAFGFLFILLGWLFFDFKIKGLAPLSLKKRNLRNVIGRELTSRSIPKVNQVFSGITYHLYSLGYYFTHELKFIFSKIYPYIFLIVVLAAEIFSIGKVGTVWEVPSYPTTIQILKTLTDSVDIFLLLLILIYSGETVWRDIQYNTYEIIESFPQGILKKYIAKILVIYFIICTFLLTIIVVGISYQTLKEYHRYQFYLFVEHIFLISIPYLVYSFVAIAVQCFSKNKFHGYLFLVSIYVLCEYLFNNVINYGFLKPFYYSPIAYSDISGFQGSLYPFIIYSIYWLLFSIIIWYIAIYFYSFRGFDHRIVVINRNIKYFKKVIFINGAIFILIGFFIYYNTSVLNSRNTISEYYHINADYEKKYKKLENQPSLQLNRINGSLNIYSSQRTFNGDIALILVNICNVPISKIYFNLPDKEIIENISSSVKWVAIITDQKSNFYGYKFNRNIKPGDSVVLRYHIRYEKSGFTDLGSPSIVKNNGTFINSQLFIPRLGYDSKKELIDEKLRERFNLSRRQSDLKNNLITLKQTFLGASSNPVWLNLQITTDSDQIAIAPGILRYKAISDGRACFRYETEKPIVNYFSLQSGKYKIYQEKWMSLGDSSLVDIYIYYHPEHYFNISIMATAMKNALNYYSNHFGKYQYQQLRIVEFPDEIFAQSFANTIAFSEYIGFLSDLRFNLVKPPDNQFDYVSYVIAHEIAHQWWGHQVIPANVEGYQFLNETLSQYAAIMVFKNMYGEEQVRNLLHLESIKYLSNRQKHKERSLEKVLKDQEYIYYSKGSCSMYLLQRYLGEERMSSILKEYIEKQRKSEVYATSIELIDLIVQKTPDSLKYLITDALRRIVIYDNRIVNGTYLRDDSLRYNIHLTLNGKKHIYNAAKVHEERMNDFVELGVYNKTGEELLLKKVRIHSGINNINLLTNRKPHKVVVNPCFDLLEKDFLLQNRLYYLKRQ